MMLCILNFKASRFIVDRIHAYKHDIFSSVSIRNNLQSYLSGSQSDGYPSEEDIYLFSEDCINKDPDDPSLDVLKVSIHFKIGAHPLKDGWFEFHPPEVFSYALSEYARDVELLYMDNFRYYNLYSITAAEDPPQQRLSCIVRRRSIECSNTYDYENLDSEGFRIVNSFLTSPLSQYLQMVPVFSGLT